MEKTPHAIDILKELSQKSGKLVRVIERLKFKNYEQFEFEGVGFLLILTSPTKADLEDPEAPHINSRSPATYVASTAIEGFDIYLVESTSLQEKKRMIFHEVFEAILSSQGMETDAAHSATLKEEERFFGGR